MAKTKHGLPQTKGFFKLKGFSTGVSREKAFQHKEFDSGLERNSFSFGVQTAPESTIYVNVEGMKNNQVYIFKRSEKKGEQGEQKVVDWAKRYSFLKEGFAPIGVSVGLEKDKDGKNVTTNYLDYDAAEKVYDQLEDGVSLFVRGDIEFSSFKNDDGELRRNKKFVVKNIYNSKTVDFEDEEFKETADFKQKFIFTGISKSTEPGEAKFIVEGKVVTYNSVEDAEFIIYNTALANQFKKGLKPYQAIEVWGSIVNKKDVEEVEEKDVWGEEDTFKRNNNSFIRELVVNGADPSSIDKETYTEKAIEEALEKLKADKQEDSSAWGESNKDIDISDDDLPW